MTPEEQEFIDWMERAEGRKLTPQEAHLALAQARSLGEFTAPWEYIDSYISPLELLVYLGIPIKSLE